MEKADENTELEKAVNMVENAGYVAISPKHILLIPVIEELSTLLEKEGFRVEKAKIERRKNRRATGRILLSVYPIASLAHLLKKEIAND